MAGPRNKKVDLVAIVSPKLFIRAFIPLILFLNKEYLLVT